VTARTARGAETAKTPCLRRPPVRAAAAVLLVVLLSGCAGSGTSTTWTLAPTSTHLTSGPRTNATTLAHGAGNVTGPWTATLHLGLAPRLNASAPGANATVVAMPLAGVYPSQGMAFNTTLRGTANLTASLTAVWLRITQSNVQAGSGTDPGCSVALTVAVVRNGTAVASYAGGCGSLGVGVVPPGDHLVQFGSAPGAFPAVRLGAGDGVVLTLTFYLSGPGLGPSAYVLAGSAERDSWVRLDGLREPTAA